MTTAAKIPDPRKIIAAALRAADLVSAAGRIVDRIKGDGQMNGGSNAADREQLNALASSLADVSAELEDVRELGGRVDAIELDDVQDDQRASLLEQRVRALEDAVASLRVDVRPLDRLVRNADRQELDMAEQRRQLRQLSAAVLPPAPHIPGGAETLSRPPSNVFDYPDPNTGAGGGS